MDMDMDRCVNGMFTFSMPYIHGFEEAKFFKLIDLST